MAKQSGGDLIVKAVEDVAELPREYDEFSRKMVQLTENFATQTKTLLQSHGKKTDAQLSALGTALGAIAREQKRTREELDEHAARLAKLEELLG